MSGYEGKPAFHWNLANDVYWLNSEVPGRGEADTLNSDDRGAAPVTPSMSHHFENPGYPG